jgi:hypothetical protein
VNPPTFTPLQLIDALLLKSYARQELRLQLVTRPISDPELHRALLEYLASDEAIDIQTVRLLTPTPLPS